MIRFIGSVIPVALLVLMSIAYAGPPSVTAQEGTPAAGSSPAADCPVLSEAEMEDLGNAYFQAFLDEDVEALRPLIADDHMRDSSIIPDLRSADEYIEGIGNYFDVFEFHDRTLEHLIVADDVIVIRYMNVSTQLEDFAGFPPSDEVATWQGITILTVECGKIINSWTEADNLSRLQQQGAIPGPQSTPEE